MTKQVVLYIHGIGVQNWGYAKQSIAKLKDAFIRNLIKKHPDINNTDLVCREVLWAAKTGRAQANLLQKINETDDLRWNDLREFMVDFAGDVIAYHRSGKNSVYDEIHAEITAQISFAINECNSEDVELTFIAHSLGTVIVSDYLYDQSINSESSENSITATNLFTLGSPLAIWLLGLGDMSNANKPILVKRPNGVWVNIIDNEDIIAYPLRNINSFYRQAVDKDLIAEVGLPQLPGLGPLSHMSYITDRNVIEPVAMKLALDYERINGGVPFSKQAYFEYVDSIWNF